MSALAWMIHTAPMGFSKPAPLRQKARYSFIELVRPDWFVPYSIEQRFGIFRWMVATCATSSTPMHPNCVNDYDVSGVSSIAQLQKRFHFALLSRDASASRWRSENGIDVAGHKILHFPHYAPFLGAPIQGKLLSEQDTQKALDGLLGSRGTLTTQLNSCHAAATEIYGVKIHVSPEGFTLTLEYGYDGSIWHYPLAATPAMWEGEGDTFRRNLYGRKSEPFINTFDRAISALAKLTYKKE